MNEKDNQFIEDMEEAGIRLYNNGGTYSGRNFYKGPAAVVDNADATQDVIRATDIRLRSDSLGKGYVVYPTGRKSPE